MGRTGGGRHDLQVRLRVAGTCTGTRSNIRRGEHARPQPEGRLARAQEVNQVSVIFCTILSLITYVHAKFSRFIVAYKTLGNESVSLYPLVVVCAGEWNPDAFWLKTVRILYSVCCDAVI